MWWIRRVALGLLAVILVLSLFGLSMSTSLNSAFSSPNHLKTWAASSGFYSSLLSKASTDTAASLGNSRLSSELNPAVKQSISSIFPEKQLNQDIDAVIDNNYAWLKGRTNAPNFKIDVTNQKNAFASDLGNFVSSQYQKLPKCTVSQLANLSVTNPLDLTCQVPTINISQIKDGIVSDVKSSSIIVKNTIITPSLIKLDNGQPYYTAYNAPAAYKHLKYAPIITAIIALICIAVIVLLGYRKRLLLTVIGACFALVGLILLLASISTDKIDSRLNSSLAKHANLSSFRTPVNNLVHKIVAYISNINLWFAIGYLLIAIALLSVYYIKRRRPISRGRAAEGNNISDIDKLNESIVQPDLTRHHAKVEPADPVLKSNRNRRLIQ